jgi:hypothetical protein
VAKLAAEVRQKVKTSGDTDWDFGFD